MPIYRVTKCICRHLKWSLYENWSFTERRFSWFLDCNSGSYQRLNSLCGIFLDLSIFWIVVFPTLVLIKYGNLWDKSVLTYQFARLTSLSLVCLCSSLIYFCLCLLRIQIQKWSYSFLDKIVSKSLTLK